MRSSAILTVAAACGLIAFALELSAKSPERVEPRIGATRRASAAPDLRAWYAAQRGDYARAVELQSITCNDDNAGHQQWRNLALYQEAAGQHEAARASWETAARAMERTPAAGPAEPFWLVETLARAGRADDALDAARDQIGAIESIPSEQRSPDTWYALGWARRHLGDEAGARDAWSIAVDGVSVVSPEGEASGTLYNRACYLALAGRRDDALAALEAAIEQGWNDAFWARQDRDFESLRADPRFERAISTIVVAGRGGRVLTP